MADNLTPMSIRSNDKSKISVSPNRATIESSRSGEQDKASNNSTALPGYGPNQRKKTSFQITSVSGSRLSNDGGDDSADDLDESHTEDISDVVDNSRVTDNETPSFSEDTYSKEDVFGNSGAPFPVIVSTSSQCGLVITPGDKSTNLNSESKSSSSAMTTTADGSGVVSGACPDRNNKEEDTACGGEDQLQPTEKINTPSLGNEFEMQLTSGEIVNTLARQDPSKLPEATKTPSPPPHEKNRFKVVKIETAEPFKRGRWTCMDFLDHSINCSATLIKCMDPEDHRRLIEAKINNRWGSPPNSNAEILKPGYLDNLDQIRANIKAAALASKWPPRTPQISKPPQNPAPAIVQQQNQQQRGFGSSVPQTFTSNAANFPQSYYNQPNSIQNNHFSTQASNVVNNTAFNTMQSNQNNNNQAYRMQTTPSTFIQQTGQSSILQPGVFQPPRQSSQNVNYSQAQFTQRCSNAHAPGTRFAVSSGPCSTVVTGAQANNYIQQVPNTMPGQQRFAPSTPVSAFGSLAQGFMVQGQTYTSQQPVYNNIPMQSQTYAGQPIMTSLPQQSQPQPYTCQPSAVPSQGQTYAGQNVTAQGQTYAGFTASGVPLQPGQTYAGQQLNGQAVFQNPNYVQQTQIRPLLQPHQQQQSIQQNLQQTQVPQTMLQQQPLAQSQVQQPIPPNQNVQSSTQQQQTQQAQGVQQQTSIQQQQSQIQSRQPQSQPVTSQAVTSTTASGYNPSAPVTTQQSQTTTSTPAVTADSTVKSSDQKSQSTAVTPSVQQTAANAARTPGQQSPTEMTEADVSAMNPTNDPDYQPTSNPAEDDSASGASTVAIDNKIEQAMDHCNSQPEHNLTPVQYPARTASFHPSLPTIVEERSPSPTHKSQLTQTSSLHHLCTINTEYTNVPNIPINVTSLSVTDLLKSHKFSPSSKTTDSALHANFSIFPISWAINVFTRCTICRPLSLKVGRFQLTPVKKPLQIRNSTQQTNLREMPVSWTVNVFQNCTKCRFVLKKAGRFLVTKTIQTTRHIHKLNFKAAPFKWIRNPFTRCKKCRLLSIKVDRFLVTPRIEIHVDRTVNVFTRYTTPAIEIPVSRTVSVFTRCIICRPLSLKTGRFLLNPVREPLKVKNNKLQINLLNKSACWTLNMFTRCINCRVLTLKMGRFLVAAAKEIPKTVDNINKNSHPLVSIGWTINVFTRCMKCRLRSIKIGRFFVITVDKTLQLMSNTQQGDFSPSPSRWTIDIFTRCMKCRLMSIKSGRFIVNRVEEILQVINYNQSTSSSIPLIETTNVFVKCSMCRAVPMKLNRFLITLVTNPCKISNRHQADFRISSIVNVFTKCAKCRTQSIEIGRFLVTAPKNILPTDTSHKSKSTSKSGGTFKLKESLQAENKQIIKQHKTNVKSVTNSAQIPAAVSASSVYIKNPNANRVSSVIATSSQTVDKSKSKSTSSQSKKSKETRDSSLITTSKCINTTKQSKIFAPGPFCTTIKVFARCTNCHIISIKMGRFLVAPVKKPLKTSKDQKTGLNIIANEHKNTFIRCMNCLSVSIKLGRFVVTLVKKTLQNNSLHSNKFPAQPVDKPKSKSTSAQRKKPKDTRVSSVNATLSQSVDKSKSKSSSAQSKKPKETRVSSVITTSSQPLDKLKKESLVHSKNPKETRGSFEISPSKIINTTKQSKNFAKNPFCTTIKVFTRCTNCHVISIKMGRFLVTPVKKPQKTSKDQKTSLNIIVNEPKNTFIRCMNCLSVSIKLGRFVVSPVKKTLKNKSLHPNELSSQPVDKSKSKSTSAQRKKTKDTRVSSVISTSSQPRDNSKSKNISALSKKPKENRVSCVMATSKSINTTKQSKFFTLSLFCTTIKVFTRCINCRLLSVKIGRFVVAPVKQSQKTSKNQTTLNIVVNEPKNTFIRCVECLSRSIQLGRFIVSPVKMTLRNKTRHSNELSQAVDKSKSKDTSQVIRISVCDSVSKSANTLQSVDISHSQMKESRKLISVKKLSETRANAYAFLPAQYGYFGISPFCTTTNIFFRCTNCLLISVKLGRFLVIPIITITKNKIQSNNPAALCTRERGMKVDPASITLESVDRSLHRLNIRSVQTSTETTKSSQSKDANIISHSKSKIISQKRNVYCQSEHIPQTQTPINIFLQIENIVPSIPSSNTVFNSFSSNLSQQTENTNSQYDSQKMPNVVSSSTYSEYSSVSQSNTSSNNSYVSQNPNKFSQNTKPQIGTQLPPSQNVSNTNYPANLSPFAYMGKIQNNIQQNRNTAPYNKINQIPNNIVPRSVVQSNTVPQTGNIIPQNINQTFPNRVQQIKNLIPRSMYVTQTSNNNVTQYPVNIIPDSLSYNSNNIVEKAENTERQSNCLQNSDIFQTCQNTAPRSNYQSTVSNTVPQTGNMMPQNINQTFPNRVQQIKNLIPRSMYVTQTSNKNVTQYPVNRIRDSLSYNSNNIGKNCLQNSDMFQKCQNTVPHSNYQSTVSNAIPQTANMIPQNRNQIFPTRVQQIVNRIPRSVYVTQTSNNNATQYPVNRIPDSLSYNSNNVVEKAENTEGQSNCLQNSDIFQKCQNTVPRSNYQSTVSQVPKSISPNINTTLPQTSVDVDSYSTLLNSQVSQLSENVQQTLNTFRQSITGNYMTSPTGNGIPKIGCMCSTCIVHRTQIDSLNYSNTTHGTHISQNMTNVPQFESVPNNQSENKANTVTSSVSQQFGNIMSPSVHSSNVRIQNVNIPSRRETSFPQTQMPPQTYMPNTSDVLPYLLCQSANMITQFLNLVPLCANMNSHSGATKLPTQSSQFSAETSTAPNSHQSIDIVARTTCSVLESVTSPRQAMNTITVTSSIMIPQKNTYQFTQNNETLNRCNSNYCLQTVQPTTNTLQIQNNQNVTPVAPIIKNTLQVSMNPSGNNPKPPNAAQHTNISQTNHLNINTINQQISPHTVNNVQPKLNISQNIGQQINNSQITNSRNMVNVSCMNPVSNSTNTQLTNFNAMQPQNAINQFIQSQSTVYTQPSSQATHGYRIPHEPASNIAQHSMVTQQTGNIVQSSSQAQQTSTIQSQNLLQSSNAAQHSMVTQQTRNIVQSSSQAHQTSTIQSQNLLQSSNAAQPQNCNTNRFIQPQTTVYTQPSSQATHQNASNITQHSMVTQQTRNIVQSSSQARQTSTIQSQNLLQYSNAAQPQNANTNQFVQTQTAVITKPSSQATHVYRSSQQPVRNIAQHSMVTQQTENIVQSSSQAYQTSIIASQNLLQNSNAARPQNANTNPFGQPQTQVITQPSSQATHVYRNSQQAVPNIAQHSMVTQQVGNIVQPSSQAQQTSTIQSQNFIQNYNAAQLQNTNTNQFVQPQTTVITQPYSQTTNAYRTLQQPVRNIAQHSMVTQQTGNIVQPSSQAHQTSTIQSQNLLQNSNAAQPQNANTNQFVQPHTAVTQPSSQATHVYRTSQQAVPHIAQHSMVPQQVGNIVQSSSQVQQTSTIQSQNLLQNSNAAQPQNANTNQFVQPHTAVTQPSSQAPHVYRTSQQAVPHIAQHSMVPQQVGNIVQSSSQVQQTSTIQSQNLLQNSNTAQPQNANTNQFVQPHTAVTQPSSQAPHVYRTSQQAVPHIAQHSMVPQQVGNIVQSSSQVQQTSTIQSQNLLQNSNTAQPQNANTNQFVQPHTAVTQPSSQAPHVYRTSQQAVPHIAQHSMVPQQVGNIVQSSSQVQQTTTIQSQNLLQNSNAAQQQHGNTNQFVQSQTAVKKQPSSHATHAYRIARPSYINISQQSMVTQQTGNIVQSSSQAHHTSTIQSQNMLQYSSGAQPQNANTNQSVQLQTGVITQSSSQATHVNRTSLQPVANIAHHPTVTQQTGNIVQSSSQAHQTSIIQSQNFIQNSNATQPQNANTNQFVQPQTTVITQPSSQTTHVYRTLQQPVRNIAQHSMVPQQTGNIVQSSSQAHQTSTIQSQNLLQNSNATQPQHGNTNQFVQSQTAVKKQPSSHATHAYRIARPSYINISQQSMVTQQTGNIVQSSSQAQQTSTIQSQNLLQYSNAAQPQNGNTNQSVQLQTGVITQSSSQASHVNRTSLQPVANITHHPTLTQQTGNIVQSSSQAHQTSTIQSQNVLQYSNAAQPQNGNTNHSVQLQTGVITQLSSQASHVNRTSLQPVANIAHHPTVTQQTGNIVQLSSQAHQTSTIQSQNPLQYSNAAQPQNGNTNHSVQLQTGVITQLSSQASHVNRTSLQPVANIAHHPTVTQQTGNIVQSSSQAHQTSTIQSQNPLQYSNAAQPQNGNTNHSVQLQTGVITQLSSQASHVNRTSLQPVANIAHHPTVTQQTGNIVQSSSQAHQTSTIQSQNPLQYSNAAQPQNGNTNHSIQLQTGVITQSSSQASHVNRTSLQPVANIAHHPTVTQQTGNIVQSSSQAHQTSTIQSQNPLQYSNAAQPQNGNTNHSIQLQTGVITQSSSQASHVNRTSLQPVANIAHHPTVTQQTGNIVQSSSQAHQTSTIQSQNPLQYSNAAQPQNGNTNHSIQLQTGVITQSSSQASHVNRTSLQPVANIAHHPTVTQQTGNIVQSSSQAHQTSTIQSQNLLQNSNAAQFFQPQTANISQPSLQSKLAPKQTLQNTNVTPPSLPSNSQVKHINKTQTVQTIKLLAKPSISQFIQPKIKNILQMSLPQIKNTFQTSSLSQNSDSAKAIHQGSNINIINILQQNSNDAQHIPPSAENIPRSQSLQVKYIQQTSNTEFASTPQKSNDVQFKAPQTRNVSPLPSLQERHAQQASNIVATQQNLNDVQLTSPQTNVSQPHSQLRNTQPTSNKVVTTPQNLNVAHVSVEATNINQNLQQGKRNIESLNTSQINTQLNNMVKAFSTSPLVTQTQDLRPSQSIKSEGTVEITQSGSNYSDKNPLLTIFRSSNFFSSDSESFYSDLNAASDTNPIFINLDDSSTTIIKSPVELRESSTMLVNPIYDVPELLAVNEGPYTLKKSSRCDNLFRLQTESPPLLPSKCKFAILSVEDNNYDPSLKIPPFKPQLDKKSNAVDLNTWLTSWEDTYTPIKSKHKTLEVTNSYPQMTPTSRVELMDDDDLEYTKSIADIQISETTESRSSSEIEKNVTFANSTDTIIFGTQSDTELFKSALDISLYKTSKHDTQITNTTHTNDQTGPAISNLKHEIMATQSESCVLKNATISLKSRSANDISKTLSPEVFTTQLDPRTATFMLNLEKNTLEKQFWDLVKSHLMFAVREEVEVLKEKIAELMDRINQLEVENSILKAHATPEALAQLAATQATTSSVAKPQSIQAQTLPAPTSGNSSATS